MKAAITGWAWRTPLGPSVEGTVDKLLAGERAASPDLGIDAGSYRCQLGAPIRQEPAPTSQRKYLLRMAQYGLEAAKEALSSSGVLAGERLGVFAAVGGLRVHWGDTMPALAKQADDGQGAWERGLGKLHPFWLLRHLSNNAHALFSAEAGARGEGVTCAGSNAGAQALGAALRSLESKAVDAAVVFAYDSLLDPEALVELAARGAATQAALPELAAPYDARAAGFVPGEAAVALVLERGERAQDRAKAFISAADGADASSREPGVAALRRTLARLDARTAVVDGVGLARPDLDALERTCLADRVGAESLLTSASAALGCCGAAGSLVQAVALAESLRRGLLYPIAGLRKPAPGPLTPIQEATRTTSRGGLAVWAGAPGLVGAVRVELP